MTLREWEIAIVICILVAIKLALGGGIIFLVGVAIGHLL